MIIFIWSEVSHTSYQVYEYIITPASAPGGGVDFPRLPCARGIFWNETPAIFASVTIQKKSTTTVIGSYTLASLCPWRMARTAFQCRDAPHHNRHHHYKHTGSCVEPQESVLPSSCSFARKTRVCCRSKHASYLSTYCIRFDTPPCLFEKDAISHTKK